MFYAKNKVQKFSDALQHENEKAWIVSTKDHESFKVKMLVKLLVAILSGTISSIEIN